MGNSSSASSIFVSLSAPSPFAPFFWGCFASGSSSMLPKVPSRPHLIKSTPAALSLSRCLQAMVVVVRPAYSRRSSGAIRDILKSFWTSTPVISCGSSESSAGAFMGCGIDASLPTTLAVLSVLKGMRSSSQLRGLKTFTLSALFALRDSSFDLSRIMLCTSP